ncbi:MAG TPA: hypothetical protein ENH23_02910 [candidate division Zixibacteria bacterium]|nr:hypothetical protein [candidate division Zixibacteria bacterium]
MKKLWRKNFPDNMRVIKDNHVSINEWLSLEDTLDKLLIIRDKLVGTDAMALRVETASRKRNEEAIEKGGLRDEFK